MLPLHVHSYFSLLRGASPVEDLVERTAALGYRGLALTDRDAVYGSVRFAKACIEAKLQSIFGAELTFDGDYHLTLLAESRTGYANLCRLISAGHRGRPKGEFTLAFSALAEHAAGLLALSGGRTGEISEHLLGRRRDAAVAAAERYRDVFGDRFYLEIQNHRRPDDGWLMAEIAALGQARGIPLVATTDVHYARPDRRMLQDILTCIRTRTTMAAPSAERLPNGFYAIPSPEEYRALFRRFPDALARTEAIAERCTLTALDFRDARFPPLDLPAGENPDSTLRRLCLEGARQRYRPLADSVLRQLEHELAVIARAGLAPFFLIASDVARRFHGRCRGSAAGSLVVYCLGVSAVDPLRYGMLFERFINPERPTLPDIDIDFSEWDREAAIAYVYQTYGADRAAMVCNYVRYRARLAVRDVGRALGMPNELLGPLAKSLDHGATGDELARSIGEFAREIQSHEGDDAASEWQTTVRASPRPSSRARWSSHSLAPLEPVGGTKSTGRRQRATSQEPRDPNEPDQRAHGGAPLQSTASADEMPGHAPPLIQTVGAHGGAPSDVAPVGAESTDPEPDSAPPPAVPWSLLARLCQQIDDFPRHLSVHVGGMLVTGQPLVELFGLEPARKEGVVVVGGDKEDVEDVGLGKLDLLCLRALSVVQEGAALEQGRGVRLDLAEIDLEDPEIYRILQQADTVGASQVESRAQMQSVVRTRPTTFRDLINQCAIIRPGPIVSGMVHPYNRRRLGLEKVVYLHPSLEPITRDTLGIFLFQEQIILGVMALTGCSAGEADVFRRAMGSHRSREAMQRLGPWFLERAVAHGIAPPVAAEAFRQISGFADFGFCRSHSAALARTAYEGLYLKRYHPAAFYAALLSNQPMGFYPTEVLVWDGRRRGMTFLPVDINRSGARCTLESDTRCLTPNPPIHLGFEQVRWVGPEVAAAIVEERAARGPYRSLDDFLQRTGVVGKAAEGLVLAGAFDFEERSRQQQLWELYGQVGSARQPSLALAEEDVALPVQSAHEQLLLDHLVLSFSLSRHLVQSYRRRLRALGVIPSHLINRLPDGREVKVGGLVVCRQRPGTAKGFVFITLEDEHGLVNVIVRPDVYQRYRDALRNATIVAIAGRHQKAFGTSNVIATRAIAIDLRTPDAEPATATFAEMTPVRSHDFH